MRLFKRPQARGGVSIKLSFGCPNGGEGVIQRNRTPYLGGVAPAHPRQVPVELVIPLCRRSPSERVVQSLRADARAEAQLVTLLRVERGTSRLLVIQAEALRARRNPKLVHLFI